ncbi:MAG: hypothetical protein AAFV53_30400 [Myxococcota bacterium]
MIFIMTTYATITTITASLFIILQITEDGSDDEGLVGAMLAPVAFLGMLVGFSMGPLYGLPYVAFFIGVPLVNLMVKWARR